MTEPGADRYTQFRELGKGNFGRVVQARDNLTGEEVAIKQIKRGPKVKKYALNEILNLRSLNHPHITRFTECFLTEKHLCIVMEYVSGGNLNNFILKRNGINQNNARWFFQQLIIAVDYCHKKRVVNRDIKLKNVLVDCDDEYPLLKICGFEYSKHEVKDSVDCSFVGTAHYMAPEVFAAAGNEQYDEKKADIWSCGVLLYAMVFNCYPFIKKEDVSASDWFNRVAMKVMNEPLNFPVHNESLEDVQDLLTKILEKDPDRRITLAQIMEHRWFRFYLPDGCLELNNDLDSKPCGYQTEKEIREMFEQAKTLCRTNNAEPPHSYAVELSDTSDSA
eukprot:g3167.t1